MKYIVTLNVPEDAWYLVSDELAQQLRDAGIVIEEGEMKEGPAGEGNSPDGASRARGRDPVRSDGQAQPALPPRD